MSLHLEEFSGGWRKDEPRPLVELSVLEFFHTVSWVERMGRGSSGMR